MSPRQATTHKTDRIVRWQPYWRDALRGIKRAVLGTKRIPIAGHQYSVAYEARGFQYDPDLVFLSRLAKNKRCVFDVGANVGVTTLVLASAISDVGKVYAFEASEASCLTIHENASLNRFGDRIVIVNACLADSSAGIATFNWNFVAGNASCIIDAPSTTPTIPLLKSTLAIDDFVSRYSLEPDLLKIDVEGSEYDVLRGMRHILNCVQPLIVIEVHSWPGMSLLANFERIHAFINEFGYTTLIRSTAGHFEPFFQASGSLVSDKAKWSRRWAIFVPKVQHWSDVLLAISPSPITAR